MPTNHPCPWCTEKDALAVPDAETQRPVFLALDLYGLRLPCTRIELEARIAELQKAWPMAVEFFSISYEREAFRVVDWFEQVFAQHAQRPEAAEAEQAPAPVVERHPVVAGEHTHDRLNGGRWLACTEAAL